MTDTAALTAEHTVHGTRLGDLTIVRDGDALTGLYSRTTGTGPARPRSDRATTGASTTPGGSWTNTWPGRRTAFDLPLAAHGSDFQVRVWELIAAVPYGQTASYGDLARRLGGGASAQEVGAAVGRNPLSILIPCHRIIGSTGKLTGYAGGLKRKRFLLDLEQARLPGW